MYRVSVSIEKSWKLDDSKGASTEKKVGVRRPLVGRKVRNSKERTDETKLSFQGKWVISKRKTENITRKWCLIFGRDGLDILFWCGLNGWWFSDGRVKSNLSAISPMRLSAPKIRILGYFPWNESFGPSAGWRQEKIRTPTFFLSGGALTHLFITEIF